MNLLCRSEKRAIAVVKIKKRLFFKTLYNKVGYNNFYKEVYNIFHNLYLKYFTLSYKC